MNRAWRDDALPGALLLQAHYGQHRFEPHLHEEVVVVVNEAGTSEVRTRLGTGVSRPGTVWVFAAGEYHSGLVPAGGAWSYRALYLDAPALAGIAHLLSDGQRVLPELAPGLHEDAALAGALRRAHLCAEMGSPLAERELAWSCAMAALHERAGGRPPKPQARCMPRMERARAFIDAHFATDFSIDTLAAETGISRYHLMRSFHRAYGLPPHAYARQLRLATAKRLLQAGRPPAEVAMETGFYDQSHLTRLFKRTFGLTPARFASLAAGR
jgi:AraC-like DNA-binding protein